MSLTERMNELIRACFSGIWIESHEHTDAIGELARICGDEDWQLVLWDIDRGIHGFGGASIPVEASDPLSAVRVFSSLGAGDGATLLVLQNFHRFLSSPEIIQSLTRAVIDGKTNRWIVVILAPRAARHAEPSDEHADCKALIG